MSGIRRTISIIIVGMTVSTNASATYNPQTGRFLQHDPLKYIDGLSLYEYARSNPIIVSDPMGGCGKCPTYCCVEDLKLENINDLDVPSYGVPPRVYAAGYGHTFDAVAQLKHKKADGIEGDCKLEWWEWSYVTINSYPTSKWGDLYDKFPQSATFEPMRNRSVDRNGNETVTIRDTPYIGGGDQIQHLFFAINWKSTPNCDCKNKSWTVYAHQYVNLDKGELEDRYFHPLSELPDHLGSTGGYPNDVGYPPGLP